jgi:hypothetical protein
MITATITITISLGQDEDRSNILAVVGFGMRDGRWKMGMEMGVAPVPASP